MAKADVFRVAFPWASRGSVASATAPSRMVTVPAGMLAGLFAVAVMATLVPVVAGLGDAVMLVVVGRLTTCCRAAVMVCGPWLSRNAAVIVCVPKARLLIEKDAADAVALVVAKGIAPRSFVPSLKYTDPVGGAKPPQVLTTEAVKVMG